jgi:hypothetical protein
MLNEVHPKLPMRDKASTKSFYTSLGFADIGAADYPEYLIMRKDRVEIHFFLFEALNPKQNYGQVYIRVTEIQKIHDSLITTGIKIHPNDPLQTKPWGQREFSLLDPDLNLLTFGEAV